jgi:hypothetical protein
MVGSPQQWGFRGVAAACSPACTSKVEQARLLCGSSAGCSPFVVQPQPACCSRLMVVGGSDALAAAVSGGSEAVDSTAEGGGGF